MYNISDGRLTPHILDLDTHPISVICSSKFLAVGCMNKTIYFYNMLGGAFLPLPSLSLLPTPLLPRSLWQFGIDSLSSLSLSLSLCLSLISLMISILCGHKGSCTTFICRIT